MQNGLKRALDRIMLSLGYVPIETTPRSEDMPNRTNKRNFQRQRQQLIEGFVSFEGSRKTYPCSVRDLNHFGGRIDLWDEVSPDRIKGSATLFIPCDGKEVDGDIAWFKDRSLGLRFRSAFREPKRVY